MGKKLSPRMQGGRGAAAYRAFASSFAEGAAGAIGSFCRAAPRFRRPGGRCCGVRTAVGRHGPAAALVRPSLSGLCRVGPQQPVFQRGAIEAANDGLHLVVGRRFDKCEALGFLGFVVSDHL